MYQALYRKWRPATFDDVVGQEHITTTLKNQVASGKPSHAYLFCGSRGTGKTSCSKILAKAVNCPNQADGNPCGACPICLGIDSNSILDVTEIDAASNSGVDNIRDLREEANFTPVNTKYRVYIIDETHMLSTGAFNALLKIMEEPPAHVIFILATTEIHKVPATILSRCQRFDFQRIPSPVIAARLEYIAGEEQATLDHDAALLIARLSDGGMRDALSLLDLCLALDPHITYKLVQEGSGLTDQSYLLNMAEAVIANDYSRALMILAELWAKSIDPAQFCSQLMSFYRNLLVVKSTADPTELVECLPEELDAYKKMAQQYPLERIFYSLTTLAEVLGKIARTASKRTEMELGLLKLCDLSVSTTPEALLARIKQLEQGRPVLSPQSVTPVAEAPKKPEQTAAPSELPPAPEKLPDEPQLTKQPETKSDSKIFAQPFAFWPEVLTILGKKNKALYGTLVNSSAYLVEDLLLVDAGSELFSQMVRTDEYARESLREAAFQATGSRYRLGPYQPEQYQVETLTNDTLDNILKSAQELGVDIEIKE